MSQLPFTPRDLGLPSKFHSFRPQQETAILMCLDNGLPNTAPCMATGSGKSLAMIGLANLLDARTCVLTSTKMLQNQYLSDFGPIGMVDVRGRGNFTCTESPGRTCEQGGKYGCPSAHSLECPYWHQYQQALKSRLVVTNYDYFIAVNQYAEGLGGFDLLILDEAHNCPQHVCSAAAVSISSGDVYSTLDSRWPPARQAGSLAIWEEWARLHQKQVAERISRFQTMAAKQGRGSLTWYEIEEWERLRDIERRLLQLVGRRGDWAIRQEHKGWYFEPLWASSYVEEYLLRHAKRRVFLSATIIPKTLSLLDITKSCLYKEFPAVFPPNRSPLLHVPTTTVTSRTQAADIAIWRGRIDTLISQRLDRRGILHSVSYRRAEDIKEHSRQAWVILTHEPQTINQAVELYRTAPPPTLLASPAVTTGYDFPGAECEYQILCKMPVPDTRDPIMEARQRADPEYRDYVAAQTLVQSCGRGMRSAEDRCENISVDNLIPISIFGKRSQHLYPSWFKKCYRRSEMPPEPPPKLPEKSST